jgi:hypothetical protein
MQRWFIPDSLVSTIAMQHHDDSPAVTVESQIIQLSYSLAVTQTFDEFYNLRQDIPEFLYESLHLSLEDISEAIENTKEEYEALASIFKVHEPKAA